MSTKSPGLVKIRGESYVEIHPGDAQKLGLVGDETVVLESKQGKASVRVHISAKAAPGVLFIPYSFSGNGGHLLTNWDLRTTRVKLEKV
jgi:sulfite reductase (NADPH) flavoprotein alpha-component